MIDTITTLKMPTANETREPTMMRESTSRPNSSVPSQCSELGGARLSRMSGLSGL